MSDPFSTAREAFVKMDDVEGRLCLIYALESGTRESTLPGAKAGEEYTFIVTNTHVLDGDVSEMIDEVPMVLEDFQFSGQAITGQLLPAVRRADGKPVLGRLTTKGNRWKTKTWILAEPTDEEKTVARAYLQDLEARKANEKPADPFAAAAAAE